MIEFPDLFEAAFREFGLWGLVIAFLVLGPGFTYVRTHNTRLKVESKAQELIYRLAQEEHDQANRLEQRLDIALGELATAREEIAQLKLDLQQARHELETVSQLKQQVSTMDNHLEALEGRISRN